MPHLCTHYSNFHVHTFYASILVVNFLNTFIILYKKLYRMRGMTIKFFTSSCYYFLYTHIHILLLFSTYSKENDGNHDDNKSLTARNATVEKYENFSKNFLCNCLFQRNYKIFIPTLLFLILLLERNKKNFYRQSLKRLFVLR